MFNVLKTVLDEKCAQQIRINIIVKKYAEEMCQRHVFKAPAVESSFHETCSINGKASDRQQVLLPMVESK